MSEEKTVRAEENSGRTPLWGSPRESFSRDLYMPATGVIAAPFAVCVPDDADRYPEPPGNLFAWIGPGLKTRGCEDLYSLLDRYRNSVPLLAFSDPGTAAELAAFAERNNLADFLICVGYRERELLPVAYRMMPVARCVIDHRGCGEIRDPAAFAGELSADCATSVILDCEAAGRTTVHMLQQRFIHVIAYCGGELLQIARACSAGVNGILTSRPDLLYGILERFPDNTFLRRRNLIAHKGFQDGGKYPENSISGVTAAGRAGFDGAEIDIKLTADDQPVVMHNRTTKGMFDCPEMSIEESRYSDMKDLRRIGYPDDGIDLFADLMKAMAAYPDTPVLIEFKPSPGNERGDRLIDISAEILSHPESQKAPITIMGRVPPYLGFVRDRLPSVPASHCEGGKEIPAPPETREECEDRLMRLAELAAGWSCGYNPEDTRINRLFYEYAKFRGLTVFPWSRSWLMNPSRWEVNGRSNDETYLAGYDSFTTDHGDMYIHLPVELEAPEKVRVKAGQPFEIEAEEIFRDGHREKTKIALAVLEGELEQLSETSYVAKEGGDILCAGYIKLDLHFGDCYHICTMPIRIEAE